MRRVRPSFTAAARRTERSIFSTGRIVAASTRSAESRVDERLGLEGEPERFEDLLGLLLPQLVDELGDEEGAEEGGRGRPLGRGQVGVARRHREAVALADGRGDADLHREAEVRDEAHHDGALLGVLLAEDGDVGEDEAEEAGDDGGDAVEVPGAARPLHPLRDAGDVDRRGEAGRVDHVDRRGEEEVDARPRGASPRRPRGRAGSARSPRPGPNCVGLTKIETTTFPARLRAWSTRARCPAWSAPIVGTKRDALPLLAPGGEGAPEVEDVRDRLHRRSAPAA